jgi:hypothetical protein
MNSKRDLLPIVKQWDPYGHRANSSTSDTGKETGTYIDPLVQALEDLAQVQEVWHKQRIRREMDKELETIKKERDEALALNAHLTLHIEALILSLPENIRKRCCRYAEAHSAASLSPGS